MPHWSHPQTPLCSRKGAWGKLKLCFLGSHKLGNLVSVQVERSSAWSCHVHIPAEFGIMFSDCVMLVSSPDPTLEEEEGVW